MNKELFELDKLFKSNKFDEVISKTKKLIKKGENFAPYYNLLGISLDNTGETFKAEKIFLEAIKKNSKEISYYSNLGKVLIKQDKLKEAENILLPQINFSAIFLNFLTQIKKKDHQILFLKLELEIFMLLLIYLA